MRTLRRLLGLGLLGAVSLHLPLPADAQTRRGRNLVLDSRVAPDPAPIGAVLSFRLTVTNTGNHPESFSVNGCPVHFRIDGSFSPRGGCPETRRTFNLDPGESVTFGPEENPHLEFDPALHPLGPGRHRVVLAVEDLGGAAAEFQILPPADFAFVSGRVVEASGEPASSGHVIVHSEDTGAGDTELLRVPLSPEGSFLLKSLAPGRYVLEVVTESGTLWYPGPPVSTDTPPLELSAREYRDLDLAFPGQRNLIPLEGMVFESPENGEAVPLGGATVLALRQARPDLPAVPGQDPGFRTETRSGEDGVFHLDLPPGTYRFLAGKLGEYRYQYWNASETSGGKTLSLPGGDADRPVRFDLTPLRDSPLAVLQGRVFVEGSSPEDLPDPVNRATVAAFSVLPSEITAAPQRAQTGPGGAFRLEVPADTPYRLEAHAPGFAPRFHPGSPGGEAPEWVETAPGARVFDLRFFLHRAGERNRGSLEGAVYRRLSTEDCAGGANCLVPVANAPVRVVPVRAGFGLREYRTRTGLDGRFRVEGLPGHRDYFAAAEGDGPEDVYAPGGVPLPLAATWRVLPGKTADAGRIVLNPEAASPGTGDGFLGGEVTDRTGRPLAGAVVRIHLQPETPRGSVISTRTDTGGRFWISGIERGVPVLVSAAKAGYVPVYYPDVHRWQDAGRVEAAPPSDRIPPISIQLDANASSGSSYLGGRVETGPETPGTLESSVLGSTRPRPLEGAFVYLEDPATGTPVAGARTIENGTVFLTGLPEGIYVVRADRPGYVSSGIDSPVGTRRISLEPEAGAAAAVTLHPRVPKLEPEAALPTVGVLSAAGNAPNPFRPSTRIRYRLERTSTVTLQVFDYRGRLVRTLLLEQQQNPGPQQVTWDARDEDGQRVSSGVYFFRIHAGMEALSRKMVVLP